MFDTICSPKKIGGRTPSNAASGAAFGRMWDIASIVRLYYPEPNRE